MITRRGFLGLLGVGAAAAVAPTIVLAEREPVRRFWQVGRNAPVGPERYVWDTAQDDRALYEVVHGPWAGYSHDFGSALDGVRLFTRSHPPQGRA